jgi:phage terminase small subunit
MDSFPAAKAAGYSDSYARVAAHRLGKKPAVVQAIDSIRTEGRGIAGYGLVEAMKEAEDAAAFAKIHKIPMANVKACELRAKLSGLLIDRVEVVRWI